MRIDAYTQISQLYKASGTKKTQNSQKTYGKDQVTISRAGAEFQMTQQAVKEAPEVREDLVASLKQQINDGTYQVSGESFAEKLMQRYNDMRAF